MPFLYDVGVRSYEPVAGSDLLRVVDFHLEQWSLYLRTLQNAVSVQLANLPNGVVQTVM